MRREAYSVGRLRAGVYLRIVHLAEGALSPFTQALAVNESINGPRSSRRKIAKATPSQDFKNRDRGFGCTRPSADPNPERAAAPGNSRQTLIAPESIQQSGQALGHADVAVGQDDVIGA